MFFPIELWREICGFLIHNIKKHGKHLQINNKNIVSFNEVIKNLPKKSIPNNGPRIIFGSQIGRFKIIKFLYNIQIPSWNTYKLIIEYLSQENFGPNTLKIPKIRSYYYSQAT